MTELDFQIDPEVISKHESEMQEMLNRRSIDEYQSYIADVVKDMTIEQPALGIFLVSLPGKLTCNYSTVMFGATQAYELIPSEYKSEKLFLDEIEESYKKIEEKVQALHMTSFGVLQILPENPPIRNWCQRFFSKFYGPKVQQDFSIGVSIVTSPFHDRAVNTKANRALEAQIWRDSPPEGVPDN